MLFYNQYISIAKQFFFTTSLSLPYHLARPHDM